MDISIFCNCLINNLCISLSVNNFCYKKYDYKYTNLALKHSLREFYPKTSNNYSFLIIPNPNNQKRSS